MPKRIPIAAARRFAREHVCRQVIICAWDGKLSHVVTYGVSLDDCAQAAEGGRRMKVALGWPAELLNAQPSRVSRAIAEAVKAKDEEIASLRRELAAAKESP